MSAVKISPAKTGAGAMPGFIRRFAQQRRGAVAIIFALTLLPLTLLVGLSIDYAFYTQARAQFELAADAASTYAIREATATYTLDTAAGQSNSTAQTNAQTAGDVAGSQWFTSQLATLPTAYVSNTTPTVMVSANQNLSPTNPAGFTATVSYVGVYPPFFDTLFGTTANWYVSGTAKATSAYSYVELLMLMDTSGSMLVPSNAEDALTMDDNSVCVKNNTVYDPNGHISSIGAYSDPSKLVTWSSVLHYNYSGTNYTGGHCASGYQGATNRSTPNAPCAFACHETTKTFKAANGKTYYQDLYGLARYLGVTLKTDDMFTATESAITAMQSSAQVAGQFTVGLYQFNDDTCPIVTGSTSDALPEATSNLSTALKNIKADDYNITPAETSFPPMVNSGESNDFTDLPQAVSDLMTGNFSCIQNGSAVASTGTALAPKPPAGTVPGSTQKYPVRDIFLITDGMEDSSVNSTCGRRLGSMTGSSEELSTSVVNCDTSVCQQLKNLGFTVYVLDITYPPVVVQFYYQDQSTSDKYINTNYPSLQSGSGGKPQLWNETSTYSPQISPNQAALEACASSQSDFFLATNSTAIQTAMAQMLKSALSSAVRIIQ